MEKVKFKEIILRELLNIGVDNIKAISFLEDGSSLTFEDIGICQAVSNYIDSKIKEIYPNFDACLPNDTFENLYMWNKDLIDGNKTFIEVREKIYPYVNLH